MSLKDLQDIFDSNGKIRFKLYSLEYIIEKENDYITAYAIDYSGRKEKYKTFKETMNNYKIYSEALINQIDKIELIDENKSSQ